MTTIERSFQRVGLDGGVETVLRPLALEVAVAIEFNGLGYATLMATPADLEDLAYGFALSERLIDRADDVVDVDIHVAEAGIIVRVALAACVSDRVFERVRHRTTDSACGLCGIENLEQAMRPLPAIERPWAGSSAAVFAAAAALDGHQPLNRMTRSVHAAARCSADGAILAVREDVGRHNGFDKLIGAMMRDGAEWNGGFALLSSRCSYELVEKAALSNCPMLATVSAPTELALRRAQQAGLALYVLVRPDALLAVTG
ncbi:formate dehydrogenase accessory sulfurtransferase FdhD [Sphingomonas koreensis]